MKQNPWWKRLINTGLRAFQGRRPYHLLIYTTINIETKQVLGYGFGWIKMNWNQ